MTIVYDNPCSYCGVEPRTIHSSYCKEHKAMAQRYWRLGKSLPQRSINIIERLNRTKNSKSLAPIQIDVKTNFHYRTFTSKELQQLVSTLKKSNLWIKWLYERPISTTETR